MIYIYSNQLPEAVPHSIKTTKEAPNLFPCMMIPFVDTVPQQSQDNPTRTHQSGTRPWNCSKSPKVTQIIILATKARIPQQEQTLNRPESLLRAAQFRDNYIEDFLCIPYSQRAGLQYARYCEVWGNGLNQALSFLKSLYLLFSRSWVMEIHLSGNMPMYFIEIACRSVFVYSISRISMRFAPDREQALVAFPGRSLSRSLSFMLSTSTWSIFGHSNQSYCLHPNNLHYYSHLCASANYRRKHEEFRSR